MALGSSTEVTSYSLDEGAALLPQRESSLLAMGVPIVGDERSTDRSHLQIREISRQLGSEPSHQSIMDHSTNIETPTRFRSIKPLVIEQTSQCFPPLLDSLLEHGGKDGWVGHAGHQLAAL